MSSTHELKVDDSTHLLLTVELTPSGMKVLDSTVVAQPLPRLRHPELQPWSLDLVDARGASVFHADLPAQNQLRGEFDDNGATAGHHLLVANTVFQVRVPAKRGTMILKAKRASLSEKDPRRQGPGEHAELGRHELP